MKQVILQALFSTLELFNIGWYEYYNEWSAKLHINFSCRRNKYTNRKYFRTMIPIMVTHGRVYDINEWVEYEGKVDANTDEL